MKNIFTRTKVYTALLCVGAIFNSAQVLSQEQAQQSSDEKIEAVEIEKIIVRSQRRAQAIEDVPVQVTALWGDDLLKNDVNTLEDLGNRIPNTFFGAPSGVAATSISIRGVAGTLATGGEEPVALFFDDQYISRYFPGSLLDIESIEVLRGPQATLYGRNATAGAVLLRSKRPNLDEPEGYVRAQLAEFGEQEYEGGFGAPIIEDVLGFRIAASYQDKDGWITNTFNGDDFDAKQSERIRGSLLWEPKDGTELYGVFEYSDTTTSIARAGVADRSISNTTRISDVAFEELRNGNFASNSPVSTNSTDTRASLVFTQEFDGFDLVLSTGYFSNKTDIKSDSDGTAQDLLFNEGRIVVENTNQDARIISTGDGVFDWLVGLSVIQDTYDVEFFDITNLGAFGGQGLFLEFNGVSDSDSYALYFEGTYAVTDRLSITAGARYTYEEKEAEIGRTFTNQTTNIALPIPGEFQGERSWNAFKPRIIAQYEVTDNLNVYASISTGFKSGGFNVFAFEEAFDDENIISYEVGTKGRFFDGVLGLSSAIFYYDYTDLQLRLGVPEGGVKIRNASDSKIQGFELEWDFKAAEGLDIYGSFSLLDAEFDDFNTIDLALVPFNAEGNQLARSPDSQAVLGADYEFYVGEDYFVKIGGVVSYRSEVFFLETDQDTNALRSESLTEIDLRVTFGQADGDWEVSVFVQNVTDEVEISQIELQGNFPIASFSEPRKFGIDFITHF